MENFDELFNHFNSLKVGVIGDVMLDSYIWGDVDRISPEAPVPVVSMHHREQRIGGAGNVALNIQSLGARAFIIAVMGKDDEGHKLKQLFEQQQINTRYLLQDAARITTNKVRVISRNQHMLRLDAEDISDINSLIQQKLVEQVTLFVKEEKPHIIVFEDYNKGVLTPWVINEVIKICKANNILTAADPKRKNFFEYQQVDIYKPNLKEVKEGLNLIFDQVDKTILKKLHNALNKKLQHQVSLITLSEKGIYYQAPGAEALIPSHIRNISDVSGAGDTVIAVAALVYAATQNAHLMAEIANIAGGLVCEQVGTVAVNRQRLLHECNLLLS